MKVSALTQAPSALTRITWWIFGACVIRSSLYLDKSIFPPVLLWFFQIFNTSECTFSLNTHTRVCACMCRQPKLNTDISEYLRYKNSRKYLRWRPERAQFQGTKQTFFRLYKYLNLSASVAADSEPIPISHLGFQHNHTDVSRLCAELLGSCGEAGVPDLVSVLRSIGAENIPNLPPGGGLISK